MNEMYLMICVLGAIFVTPFGIALAHLYGRIRDIEKELSTKASEAYLKEYVGLKFDVVATKMEQILSEIAILRDIRENGSGNDR